ncbi:hypothetical protein QQ045_012461 [Rhodiola kirilowii]
MGNVVLQLMENSNFSYSARFINNGQRTLVVTSLYKVTLSNQKQLMITVAWSKTQMGIDFRDIIKLSSFKFNVNSQLFRKSKGSKTIESENWKIEVCWDLSAA